MKHAVNYGFGKTFRICERFYNEIRKELTMPDWEGMILARQDERAILEDECNGNCELCPYKGIRPPWHRVTEPEEFPDDYYCTLFDNEE